MIIDDDNVTITTSTLSKIFAVNSNNCAKMVGTGFSRSHYMCPPSLLKLSQHHCTLSTLFTHQNYPCRLENPKRK